MALVRVGNEAIDLSKINADCPGRNVGKWSVLFEWVIS